MATANWTGGNGDWGTTSDWSTGGIPGSNDAAVINTTSLYTVTFSNTDDSTVSTLTVGNDHFNMTGGALEILKTASFASGFAQSGGSLIGSAVVTLTGGGTIIGGYAGGTIAFHINSTTALANYTLGGGVTWLNSSTTNQTAQITVGDTTGANAGITNQAGATYNLEGDFGITDGSASASFVNAGTLAKAAGSGTSVIAIDFTNTGTIAVTSGGLLEFSGPANSFAGTISGAGTLAVGGGGVDTLQSGAKISTGGLGVFDNGTRLTLDESLTYAGAFTQTAGSTVFLNGLTLTLAGSAAFSGVNGQAPTISSSGTLVTKGATALGQAVLGATASWLNDGTINETSTLQLGDGSGQAVTFTNAAGAIYDLTDDSGIIDGASTASRFASAGLLEDTDGTGISTIAVNLTDTGAISVAGGGELAFTGPINSFTGTISGTGEVALGGASSDTIGSGTTIAIANFQIYGNQTVVTLGENLSYAGNFSLNSGSFIGLNGKTLTLTGGASFANQNGGTPTVDGSGTLVTSGATAISQFILGGTATWQNTGTISETGFLTLDDTTGQSVTITNEAKAVYNLTDDAGIGDGPSLASTFVNIGTLNDADGTGTSSVGVNVTDTGTIMVAGGGELEFNGPINSFTGTISGSGEFAIGGGSSTIASGATITASSFGIFDNNTTVTLQENLTYAGSFTQGEGSFLNLNGHTLTLSLGAQFSNFFSGTPSVDGSGTLVTKGNVSVNQLVLGGSVAWQNYGTVSDTAPFTLGDSSGRAVTFTNEAGAIYDLTDDSGIEDGASAASSFVNTGTLEDTDSVGATSINADVVDTGTVTVVAYGQLEFNGPISSFAGTISGPGQIIFGNGGSDNINAGTAMTIANWAITGNNTDVSINENLSYAGYLSAGGGTGIAIASGTTLSLTSTTSLGGSTSGAGTLAIGGGIATVTNDASFGAATVAISGSGTDVYLAASGGDTGNLSLGAGATLNVELGQNFTLSGTTTIAGTITGNGALVLAGTETLNSGTALSVADVTISFGTATLTANLAYTANFSETGGSVALGGKVLTLNGPVNFNGGTVSGSGYLYTKGVTTLQSLVLNSGAIWDNDATIIETGGLTLGNVGSGTGQLSNIAGATFDITGTGGVTAASGGIGRIVNQALFEKTAGGGVSTIGVVVTNNGTLSVTSGTLDFVQLVNGTGSAQIASTGTLEFDGSVASTQTITFSSTPGAFLTLNDPSGTGLGFAGTISGFGQGDTIDLTTFAAATGEKATWTQNGTHGSLVIADGAKTATLALFGQYVAAGFGVANDGHGGTIITYNPAGQSGGIAVPHH